MVDDVVGVVGGLLGASHVLLIARHVLHGLLGTEENPHDAWQHRIYRVAHFRRNHLGLAFGLVSKWVATVVASRLGPDWRQVAVDVGDGILDLCGQDALQRRVVHRLICHRTFIKCLFLNLALNLFSLAHR